MFGKDKRKKIEILEEKAKFAESVQQIWVHANYTNIKEAHNEILEYLKEKNFDFFSVQYLLTMTYMELLVNEYLESHKSEIKTQIKNLIKGEN